MGNSTATRPEAAARSTARLTLPGQARAAVAAMRPREWTKNLLLFAGILFSGHVLQAMALSRAVLAAAAFCLASGAIYLINDLVDVERDRQHPKKRLRPLASGQLSSTGAIVAAVLALAGALALAVVMGRVPLGGVPDALRARLWPPALALNPNLRAVVASDPYALLGGSTVLFTLTLVGFVALQFAYSFQLKHIVLVDVFAIAAGFVLRAVAGAVAVAVPISPWLYLCTILLSLFLALAKRRNEVVTLAGGGVAHRLTLQDYSLPLIDQLITIVTAATIMAYSLYTFQSETGGAHYLMLTIPFVIYGIFRYLYLMHARQLGGNPAEVLWRDRHVQWAVAGWVIVAGLALYVVPR